MSSAPLRCPPRFPVNIAGSISFKPSAARLGGEAISFLTFTGPLLGEATKVALLRKRVPLTYGVPALVVDNLLYNLSVVFFILSGACVMLFTYSLPPLVYYSLVAIAVIAALGIAAAVWRPSAASCWSPGRSIRWPGCV